MVEKKLCDQLIETLEPVIKMNGVPAVIRKLFDSGVIDVRRCKIALIRKYVNTRIMDNMRAGRRPEIMLLIEDAAHEYNVSNTFVQNCIYKHKNIDL